jgi:peptidoglycan/LPS O-acetylase OafA/YrhL
VSILCYVLIKILVSDGDFSQILIHHFTKLLATKDPAIFFRLNPAFWSMPVFLVFFFLKSFLNLKARLLHVLLFLFLSQLSNINQFNALDTFGTPIFAMIKFLWIFLLGGWVGNQEECKLLQRASISIPVLLITLIAVVYMGVYYQSVQLFFKFKNNFHIDQEVVMGLVFGFFLYCLQYSPLSKLNVPFLSTYGKMSFAIYLLHNLMVLIIDRELGAFGLVLSLTITIVISALFTFCLERPCLRKFK